MKTETLCQLVLDELDNGTMTFYRDVLFNEPLSVIRDPMWQAAAILARKLAGDEQEVLLSLMRRASIDATSTLFGAIDGNTSLADQFIELSLNDSEGQCSDDLQDIFIRLSEQK